VTRGSAFRQREHVASIAFAAACVLLVATSAAGQPTPTAPPIAITNINLIRMRGDVVEPRSAVVVQDGRIREAGRMNDVRIPANATVIDGAGGYLLPGLTDAHVHLATDMPWADVRRGFGDAPLFLAHGVTSVVNLRGTPEQLEWRRRIERGELLAPTLYTSGDFIDEPRVITADDVTREVDAQRRAGVDLLKFHPVWTPQEGDLTTSGLSADAYRRLVARARMAGLPLVGHAPGDAGLDGLLEARQTVAHMGVLSNAYFLPIASHRRTLLAAATALAVLVLASAVTLGAALAARWRGRVRPRSRLESMTSLLVVLALIASGIAAAFMPGGPWFESAALRIAFSAAAAAAIATAVSLALQLKHHVSGRGPIRLAAGVVVCAAALLVGLTLALAIPIAWRSTDSGIARLAERLRQANVSVQTTLINYDLYGPGRRQLLDDAAIAYLAPATRERWRREPEGGATGYAFDKFMRAVTGGLHRAGVPLIAGTDAFGLTLVTPGSSLHREFALLRQAGLTPYDVLRTATVNTAQFLGREREFGAIEVGARADLLLVDASPLDDLATLKRPRGVMVRGRWLTRQQLDDMLAGLAGDER
jgi:imidazolonepropionase-like amidohydrolase